MKKLSFKAWSALMAVFAGCLLAAAPSVVGRFASAADRAPMDPTYRVVSPELAHHLATGPLVSRSTVFRLGFVLAAAHPAALAQYDDLVSTPGSKDFHHFLSAAAVNRRFGPAASALAHDEAVLRHLGYTSIVRQGFIIYATATVARIHQTLRVVMHHAVVGGAAWTAPATAVHVPAALRDVAVVTGLVRSTVRPHAARSPRWHLAMRAAPVDVSGPRSTSEDGYTITTTWLPSGPILTGLPATAEIVVTGPNGQPATTDSLTTVTQTGGPGQLWWNNAVGPDPDGHLGLSVTAAVSGTYTMTIELAVGTTTPLTVTLPALVFDGGTAASHGITPALATTALGASGVVSGTAQAPATIGVYADAAPEMSDVKGFESLNSLAPLTVKVVPVDGFKPPVAASGGELTLDLESLAMASPGATVVVTAVNPNLQWPDGLLDALNAAHTDDNVSVFSVSYGGPESIGGSVANAWSKGQLQAIATGVEAANVEGITVVAAAGDNGAFETGGGQAMPLTESVDVPSDVPQVTAVGGVDFRVSPAGTGLATASWGGDTWLAVDAAYLEAQVNATGDSGNLLGGGGYSIYFPVPAWQAAWLPPASSGRGVPDVALPASENFPGILMQFDGQPGTDGGTSMAAPLFAGYLADMAAEGHQRLGNVNPALYEAAREHPSLMTEPLYGFDGVWSVTPGRWNPLTGLGTPNIGQLAQDIASLETPTIAQVSLGTGTVWTNAGHAATLAVELKTPGGAPILRSETVHVTIRGSMASKAETVTLHTKNQHVLLPALDQKGVYNVTVRAGTATASTVVKVAPGWPAAFHIHRSPTYHPGTLWREGLAAYDVYGNLDGRIVGTVLWTWHLDGRVYHDTSHFAAGIAWGQFAVPKGATGALATATVVHWRQTPLP